MIERLYVPPFKQKTFNVKDSGWHFTKALALEKNWCTNYWQVAKLTKPCYVGKNAINFLFSKLKPALK